MRASFTYKGSPDPDGRQIDGMGGGLSSLSKTVVISTPGEPGSLGPSAGQIDAATYAWPDKFRNSDDVAAAGHPSKGWDIVYRFGQVGVREASIDWGSTCGNLVAGVAQFAVDEGFASKAIRRAISNRTTADDVEGSGTIQVTLRILAVDSGKVVLATLPVSRRQAAEPHSSWLAGSEGWVAVNSGEAEISGVPGLSAPISIENPLETDPLPTGRVLDHVDVDGTRLAVSIVNAGLPVIFVASSSVEQLIQENSLAIAHPADLDANSRLHELLEGIRQKASSLTPFLSQTLSPSAPKICLVGPPATYETTSGTTVDSDGIDLSIRAVSVGNFHRTVPATMLSALAVANALPGSIVAELSASSIAPSSSISSSSNAARERLSIRIGQPAGVSEAAVSLDPDRQPTSIAYVRTARRLFQGEVLVPPGIV